MTDESSEEKTAKILASENSKLSRYQTVRRLGLVALAGCAIFVLSTRAEAWDWSGLVANPLSVEFGKEAVGGTSAAKQATITNRSDRARKITRVLTTAGFGESNNCGVLNPRASCKVQVTFGPTATGKRIGALIVRMADRDDDSGTLVLLTGTGTASGGVTISGTAMQGGQRAGRP
jgi:hypothetical protein